MKKKLFSNWGLKLLSLVLAFTIWFVVVANENPPDTKNFYNIPVTILNEELLKESNRVYEVLDGTDVVRQVTVKAPKDIISELTRDNIVATADISKLTSIDTIPIEFSVPEYNMKISDIKASGNSSDIVKIQLDESKSKNVQLLVKYQGQQAEGYVVETPSVDPNRIKITGAATKIDQVDHAEVRVDITDISSKLSTRETIRLYDAEGNQLEDSSIDKTVTQANVTVTVLPTKTVPIKYSVSGVIEDGYYMTGTESSLREVTIAGNAAVLNSINEILIPETLLDITGQTEDMVINYNLEQALPSGVKLVDSQNNKVTFHVYIEEEVQSSLNILPENIQLINIPENVEYEILADRSSYEMKVTGLQDRIDKLNVSNLRANVDIKEWMKEQNIQQLVTGTYQIPVTILLPRDIEVNQRVSLVVNFTVPQEAESESE